MSAIRQSARGFRLFDARRVPALVLLLLAGSLPGAVATVSAQDPLASLTTSPQLASAVAGLTVEDAVREALDHNLTLVAERYSVSVARARILTAQLRPNPVLTVNGMFPDSAVYDNDVSPREGVVRTDFLFERGSKRDHRIEVAEAAQSVAELQLLNTIRKTVLDVQSAFVEVVLASQNRALARASLDAFNSIVQVNTIRVRTGDLAGVELERSRLAALQFQNEVRQQEAKLLVARNRLRTLLGRPLSRDVDVADELRRDQTPMDLEAVRARALQQRPDLLALRREEARTSADVRLQIAQGKIDYTISGEFHHQRQGLPTPAAGNMYAAYVSVPLPLFNRNQGEIARAHEEERQAGGRTRALEADIAAEVQAAYTNYSAARDVVDTIESQMLTRARDVRATTEYSYRAGEASFIEFLDAVRTFNETIKSYNEARAEYARSLYELDATAGRMTP